MMNEIPLILLYGAIGKKHHGKQQKMIDGGMTCGYRSYARFGHIVYLCPQDVRQEWEHSIPGPSEVVSFISRFPDAVVWSIKHDKIKDKKILRHIPNRKLYYSCCSRNMYNGTCDVSLVDTEKRLKGNAQLHIKGKDPDFWKPLGQDKEFDFLLMGRRADKNEIHFLKALQRPSRVLWIGGDAHRHKLAGSRHHIEFTKFAGAETVRNNIPRAKVGILFTEHPAEGFPQSFLEMTMCGVPVIYSNTGPFNPNYFCDENSRIVKKADLSTAAIALLSSHDAVACREASMDRFSLQKSYERMIGL